MKRGPQWPCQPKRASPLHGNCDEYLEWVIGPITGLIGPRPNCHNPPIEHSAMPVNDACGLAVPINGYCPARALRKQLPHRPRRPAQG
jgi:hypothetical protein